MEEEKVTRPTSRKPIRNFLIKRSMQAKIILTIFGLVILTSLLTVAILAWLYNVKSQAGSFYYMSNDVMQDLELTSILGVVLPAIAAAQLVSLVIAFAIGLFSSRKAAVPVYKIEKWAGQLRSGNLNTLLAFRDQDDLKELELQCNGVTDFYRGVLSEVHEVLESLEREGAQSEELSAHAEKLKKALRKVVLQ
jgi:methyl-accepting chemotaxis protein